jgi:hypothetical protein
MRLSRVLLAGAAVAAAGIATSAFTAGNTVEASVAGYGNASVTGVRTTDINYLLDSTDKSEVTRIDFTIIEDLDGVTYQGITPYLQLEDADGFVGAAITCDIAGLHEIQCTLPADTKLASFNKIGLTVAE